MNINIKYIDKSYINVMQQIEKCKEEEKEFYKAIENLDKENLLEEFFDNIQSKLGILKIFGITKEDLESANKKHKEKLEKRNYKFIEL